jgi:hypothetical protein
LGVDVSITVVEVTEFILSLELRGWGDGGSYWGSIGVSSFVTNGYSCGGIWVACNTMDVWVCNILCR